MTELFKISTLKMKKVNNNESVGGDNSILILKIIL